MSSCHLSAGSKRVSVCSLKPRKPPAIGSITLWQTLHIAELLVGFWTDVRAVESTGRCANLKMSVARKFLSTMRARLRPLFVGVVSQRFKNAGVVSTPAAGTPVVFWAPSRLVEFWTGEKSMRFQSRKLSGAMGLSWGTPYSLAVYGLATM